MASKRDGKKARNITVAIKTKPVTDAEYDVIIDVIDTQMSTLFAMHLITDAEVDPHHGEKMFDVYYEERYCKRVSAVTEKIATDKVTQSKQGETVYFDSRLTRVEEVDDQG